MTLRVLKKPYTVIRLISRADFHVEIALETWMFQKAMFQHKIFAPIKISNGLKFLKFFSLEIHTE